MGQYYQGVKAKLICNLITTPTVLFPTLQKQFSLRVAVNRVVGVSLFIATLPAILYFRYTQNTTNKLTGKPVNTINIIQKIKLRHFCLFRILIPNIKYYFINHNKLPKNMNHK